MSEPLFTTKIEFNGSKIRLLGFGIQRYQMALLGQFALNSIKARVAKGVGSDDAAMKPLTDRYRVWKQKIGLPPIRDLMGPGQTSYMARVYEGRKRFAAAQAVRAPNGRMYSTTKAPIGFRSAGGGAHMLDNFTVRSASETEVRLDITAQWARDRARGNEQRAPWFGFSPNDVRGIVLMAQQIFKAQVSDMAVRLMGQKGGQVWMNPFGSQSEMLRKVA